MSKYDIIFHKNNDQDKDDTINHYFLDNETKPIQYLPNFNKINIIVGANNSGKSRFMRYFIRNFNDFLISKKEIFDKYNDLLNEYNNDIKNSNPNFYNDCKLTPLELKNEFGVNLNKNKVIFPRRSFHFQNQYESKFTDLYNSFTNQLENIKSCYIPTLRTAHSLYNVPNERNEYKKIEEDIFLETLKKYYKLHNIDFDVFTGIHLYKDILNTRNSKREIRRSFEEFEDFISKNFFSGKKVDIVAQFSKDENLKEQNSEEIISVHIDGDKETRNLYELGDGIQAIIILMYKIFMAKENSFIFIDEPELNLHPGMQRLFLEQVSSNEDLTKKNLRYVISTHSNHFLDLTIEKEDVSIYSFSSRTTEKGENQFVIKNVNAGDNQMLKNLGVNNSSVFMANCSIWVEGISDRNYIKAFLKSYTEYLNKKNKKNYVNLKEDIDYAFFEYAGSNIDHYIFDNEVEKDEVEIILNDIKALSLSNRIFLLADSDDETKRSKKGKGLRLKKLEESKSYNFMPKICWNIREIENLITNDIWEEILIDFCDKNLVKSNTKVVQEKIEGALLKFDASDYSKQYIGEFLNNLRDKMDKISSKFILNQSTYEVKKDSLGETAYGSIIKKRELSEIIFKKNFPWEILSKNKEIKSLTIQIYNFITNKQ